MSKMASLDITFHQEVEPAQLIKLLLENGWNIASAEGKTVYLPLGTADVSCWEEEQISIQELTDTIREKEKAGETIGRFCIVTI